MLGLMCFLLAATTATAGLPTRKQPAHPWEAEPPTAETMRQLHKMLLQPQSPGNEPISEEDVAASFDGFLLARGGRLQPIWANHSHAERTASLQHHHASRRSERRRAQAMMGTNLFADDTAGEKESSLTTVLDPPTSTCDDPLATNTGQPTPCTYDCVDLQREYFPAPQPQTTRCFLFDPDTQTWPEVGGQGDELLSMRQQRFETHTYISVEDGTNPPPSGLSFTMGEGRACRDVTIKTFMGMESREEVVCLVDGEHEYNHTVTEEHSVEVVGYAESGVHTEAGGTTAFVIGSCTDALIRVTTTSASGSSMTWSLDDGGHNGPWTFETSGEVGVEVRESCMFDNEFTLTLQGGGGSGWEGSVEVAGFIRYHNTITIPNDENWIVQGIVDPVSGLPSSLDARLKSGTAMDRSHANIVMRHLRISGQVAPLDVNPIGRNAGAQGLPTFGGAFEYDGGSADPDDLVKLVFIRVVFDHNVAPGGAGGAVWIDGRGAMPSLDSAAQIWESGIALTISACTFFRNFAYNAGALGVFDAWPLEAAIDDTDFVHNDCFLWQHECIRWSTHSGTTLRTGAASVIRTSNHYDGGFASGIFTFVAGTVTWVDGSSPDEPDATWIATHESSEFVDHASWWGALTVFLATYPVVPDKLIRTEWKFVDLSVADSITLAPGPVGAFDSSYAAAYLAQGSSLVDRCRFERNGNFDESAAGQGGIVVIPSPGGSIVPSWEFNNSEWVENGGGNGPAVYLYYGNFGVRFFRCLFSDNFAYQSAGAIFVQGSALSALLVEESVFDSNAVRKSSTDTSGTGVTVRVDTGGPTGDPAGYQVPIWRIDDGPVYGLSWEQCQLASHFSQDAVSKGLPPSWPNLDCANISYTGPDSSFAQVVSLTEGLHTLWTGLLMMTQLQNLGWQRAWIELVDTIGPLYPTPPETRPEQFPRCRLAQCAEPDPITNPACIDMGFCPTGVAMWSCYNFSASTGNGGAIATAGPAPVAISDTVFRTNAAPKGASLSVTAATSLRITNTTIDEPEDDSSSAVWTIASAVAMCAENPCEAGSKCTFKDFSTFCETCSDNEIGTDGVECSACTSGTQPDDSHTVCRPCAVGTFSTIGVCFDCDVDAGKTSNEDKDGCEDCPLNQLADPPELGCRCKRGYYNSSAVRPACFRGAWAEDDVQDESAVCLPCDKLECIADCQGDWLQIDAGWSPAEASGINLPIFTCKYNQSEPDLPPSCPRGNVSSSGGKPCADGYQDPLCGACDKGFTLKSDGSCASCGGTSLTSATIVGIVTLLAFAVLVKTVPIWFNYVTMLQEIVELTRTLELKAISKMLVATMQILGNLSDVLSIRLPEIFTSFLASFVSFFK
eukprot:COSAG04_NODE_775_length_10405_cov_20.166214_6_plen_1349_part_00